MLHKDLGISMSSQLNQQISSQRLLDNQKKIFSELASFQWIHVSEELPALGKRVLLFFRSEVGKSSSRIILGQLVYANESETCYLLDCGEIETTAEYWMPLPYTP